MVRVTNIIKNGIILVGYECTDGKTTKTLTKDQLATLIDKGVVENAEKQVYKNTTSIKIKEDTNNDIENLEDNKKIIDAAMATLNGDGLSAVRRADAAMYGECLPDEESAKPTAYNTYVRKEDESFESTRTNQVYRLEKTDVIIFRDGCDTGTVVTDSIYVKKCGNEDLRIVFYDKEVDSFVLRKISSDELVNVELAKDIARSIGIGTVTSGLVDAINEEVKSYSNEWEDADFDSTMIRLTLFKCGNKFERIKLLEYWRSIYNSKPIEWSADTEKIGISYGDPSQKFNMSNTALVNNELLHITLGKSETEENDPNETYNEINLFVLIEQGIINLETVTYTGWKPSWTNVSELMYLRNSVVIQQKGKLRNNEEFYICTRSRTYDSTDEHFNEKCKTKYWEVRDSQFCLIAWSLWELLEDADTLWHTSKNEYIEVWDRTTGEIFNIPESVVVYNEKHDVIICPEHIKWCRNKSNKLRNKIKIYDYLEKLFVDDPKYIDIIKVKDDWDNEAEIKSYFTE